MQKTTIANLVKEIHRLPRNKWYEYVPNAKKKKNENLIEIVSITLPEGPIRFKRHNRNKTANDKIQSISTRMIGRIANAFKPDYPINLDRLLGASYNTRSVFEALLAHTPQFYYCYPGRIDFIGEATTIEHGHKHLIWKPDEPHSLGIITQTHSDIVISEVPGNDVIYNSSLTVPSEALSSTLDQDINIKRRHTQIQIALIHIARQMGYKVWIAQNDKGIIYNDQKLGEIDGVIKSLNDSEIVISSFDDVVQASLYIDCIWFRNRKFMPAVIEIEHSTGITSGLTRMKNLQDALPPFETRYVIVAPDESHHKVVEKANREMFRSLRTRFFPYSAVEELYSLCQRRNLRGIQDEFLDCYMENVVS
ncbi:MAG: restriction endonuclease [Cyanobacteria bacterium P01_G01_bin.54]